MINKKINLFFIIFLILILIITLLFSKIGLIWISNENEPNPWEIWENAPLWYKQPNEEILISSYYQLEYGINILKYEQIKKQDDINNLILNKNISLILGICSEPPEEIICRSLEIKIQVRIKDLPPLLKEGWKIIKK